MNALFAVAARPMGDAVVQTVNARDLHAFLESKADFSTWIKQQIERARLADGRDYLTHNFVEQGPSGGKHKTDYHLTFESAKHIGMMSGTDKGFEVRDYFIECERRALATPALNLRQPAQMLAVAVQLAEIVQEQQAQLTAQAPKVAFAEAVGIAENTQTVEEVGKLFGWSKVRMFKWLREEGVLMANNLPIQKHLDAGRFRVIEKNFEAPTGEVRNYVQTVITGKGVTYLQQRHAKSLEAAHAT